MGKNSRDAKKCDPANKESSAHRQGRLQPRSQGLQLGLADDFLSRFVRYVNRITREIAFGFNSSLLDIEPSVCNRLKNVVKKAEPIRSFDMNQCPVSPRVVVASYPWSDLVC